MICPYCGIAMAEEDAGKFRFDRCDTCGRIWISSQELSHATLHQVGNRVADIQGTLFAHLEGPAALRCPVCDGRFLWTTHMGSREVETCKGCWGVLLDPGELDEIRSEARRTNAREIAEAVMHLCHEALDGYGY